MARKPKRAQGEQALVDGWKIEADEVPNEEPAYASLRSDDEAAALSELSVADTEAAEGAIDPDAPEQLSNAAMVMLGVFGGLYLAYTWIWFSWAEYMVTVSGGQLALTRGSLGAALQTLLYWLAPLAPAAWFIATLRANRGERRKRVILWLIIGAIVLIPLPYLVSGHEATGGVTIGLFPLWGAQ